MAEELGGTGLGGLHHVAIQVRDLPRLEGFYTRVLGLRVIRRWPWSEEELARGKSGERSVWLSLGGGRGDFLALEACDGEARAPEEFSDPAPGLHVLALRIAASERAGWETRLPREGVRVERRTRWSLFFRDTEGNRVALTHHPDDMPGA